jgi:hypothetical protein
MTRSLVLMLSTLLSLGLAGCGEKPQTASTRKSDSKAWSGSAVGAYVAPGWKPGDQTSWEDQMRNRAQTQNEYSRAAAGGGQ